MRKNQFKVGQAVVYTELGGASHSATVVKVDRNFIHVFWLESLGFRRTAMVAHKDSDRVVPFGKSMFLAL